MISTFRHITAAEGPLALLTGLGPTVAGYFLQGACKFGGYEFFKKQCVHVLGPETASNHRTAVYLASSALAEFFADIALCPLEATRIRLVAQPGFASGLVGGLTKIARLEGAGALFSGFGPLLFKQYVVVPRSWYGCGADELMRSQGTIHRGAICGL
jgi:solute carrier family 25 phosphate transporter 3